MFVLYFFSKHWLFYNTDRVKGRCYQCICWSGDLLAWTFVPSPGQTSAVQTRSLIISEREFSSPWLRLNRFTLPREYFPFDSSDAVTFFSKKKNYRGRGHMVHEKSLKELQISSKCGHVVNPAAQKVYPISRKQGQIRYIFIKDVYSYSLCHRNCQWAHFCETQHII